MSIKIESLTSSQFVTRSRLATLRKVMAGMIIALVAQGAWADEPAYGSAPHRLDAAIRAYAGVTLKEAGEIPQITRLKPRPGLMIPNPPFSLAGLAEDRKMAPAMADRWRTCLTQEIDANLQAGWLLRLKHPLPGALPGRRYAIFHGIGMSSQRRLLTSYYENSDELRAQDVFALSPWIVLGLRNGISGTLIDVTRPRTWYPIGFLLDVPLECIFTTSKTDAYVPMEATPYDQQAFRRRFLGQNPLTMEQRTALRERIHQYILDHDMDPQDLGDQIEATNELEAPFREEQGFKPAFGPKSRKDILDPATLLGDPYDIDRAVFNEVGFFSRISDPERSVRITAVVITSSGKYATAVDWPDAHPDNNNYETQARQLAKRLGLPFYDLRLIPGM